MSDASSPNEGPVFEPFSHRLGSVFDRLSEARDNGKTQLFQAFWRVGSRKLRLKTAKTGKTVVENKSVRAWVFSVVSALQGGSSPTLHPPVCRGRLWRLHTYYRDEMGLGAYQ